MAGKPKDGNDWKDFLTSVGVITGSGLLLLGILNSNLNEPQKYFAATIFGFLVLMFYIIFRVEKRIRMLEEGK